MFQHCHRLTAVPLFDTSKVTDTNGMFMSCSSLLYSPNFNTNKVTNMSNMYKDCYSLKEMPSLDTSNVTNAQEMYARDAAITSTIPLYNTTNMTNMNQMFYGCTRVAGGSLALYEQANAQGNVTGHNGTFHRCGVLSQTGSAELAQIPSAWTAFKYN